MATVDFSDVEESYMKSIWDEIAPNLSKLVFNNKMVVIRNLEDVKLFDLFICFVKDAKGLLGKKEYALIGHICDLIKTTGPPPGTNLNLLLKTCSNLIKEDVCENFQYNWKKDGDAITVDIQGMNKYVINWAIYNKQLVLDKSLDLIKPLKTIYLINEVVYADNVSLNVKFGGGKIKKEDIITTRTPLAFSYNKFPVNSEGVLGPAIKNKVDPSADFYLVVESSS
jgi:hypothetical protein